MNFRLTEPDAWELATSICDAHDALRKQGRSYYEEFKLAILGRGPDAREWLRRMGRQLSFEDEAKVAQWIERVHSQRLRLNLVAELMALDDPGALRGEPVAEPSTGTTHFSQVQSTRIAAGKRPLHSELTRQFLGVKERSMGYHRALAQFREVCGDKDVAIYTIDDCWTFRNWLSDTKTRREANHLPVKPKTISSVQCRRCSGSLSSGATAMTTLCEM